MSRNSTLTFAILCLGLCMGSGQAQPRSLGKWPLCEASAAARDPSSDQRVWIADNEHSGDLFAFDLGTRGLDSMQRLGMPGGDGLRDIEALATAGDRLLVVASHGRNKLCEVKPKRWQLRWLHVSRGGALKEENTIDTATLRKRIAANVSSCVTALFEHEGIRGARAVCQALAAGENTSDRAHCGALNIEGAVAVPEQGRHDAASPIWLGLRNPLVAGRAILLRMGSDSHSLRFDAVATIDLGGRGVRELAYSEGMLWGIAGPSADALEPFRLFGFRSGLLEPGAVIAAPARQSPLPPQSEGLVIDGTRAIVVIDGEIGGPPRTRCDQPSLQRIVALP